MTVVKTTESIFEVFEQLTLIVRTAIVAVCFDYRFFHYPSVVKLFQNIGTFSTMNEEFNIRKLGFRIKVIVGVSFFFIFLHLLFASIFMFHTSTSSYVNWLFYGETAGKTPDYIVRSIMIADWALYLYLVICNECFFTTFFLALCMIITMKIKDYDEMICRIHREKLVKNAVQVQELYQKHTRLTEIVNQANDSFSFPAFLWILCIIFNLAVKIESIIRGAKESDFNEFGYIFTDVLYYSLGFIGICTIAGNLSGVDSDAVVALTKIAEEGDIKDWVFQQEVQLLLTKLNTPMLKITGWSCFELNLKFMLTILGALATYTIIILQMA
ncbi:gustatory receptor 28b isoform X2 [Brevipalpus obovatus]